jgi:hypothetical protein
MIELLLPYGFDTLKYTWVKATTGICTFEDYSVAKKCQHIAVVMSKEEHRSSLASTMAAPVTIEPMSDQVAVGVDDHRRSFR